MKLGRILPALLVLSVSLVSGFSQADEGMTDIQGFESENAELVFDGVVDEGVSDLAPDGYRCTCSFVLKYTVELKIFYRGSPYRTARYYGRQAMRRCRTAWQTTYRNYCQ